jgi:endonuclease YncB( thermonuclease family)
LRRHALAGDRGRAVRLIADPTQARRDRYDRLLAYVETPAGNRDLAREVIAAGWGRTYVYDEVPFRRVREYRAAERDARRAGAGVWGRCSGDFHSGTSRIARASRQPLGRFEAAPAACRHCEGAPIRWRLKGQPSNRRPAIGWPT